MNILFVANHHKTIFFKKIADELSKIGYRIYWLSPSTRWSQWLFDNGVTRNDMLTITDFSDEWKKERKLSDAEYLELAELEKINDLAMNDLILMDRLLKLKPYAYALRYLSVCNKYITNFLKINKINIVFYEATWAMEVLLAQICTKLSIKIFCVETARIVDRFIFCEGFLADSFVNNRVASDEHMLSAETIYENIFAKSLKPAYFILNNKPPKLSCKYIKSFGSHLKLSKLNESDETYTPISKLIKDRIFSFVRYKFIIKQLKLTVNDIKDKPYVLYPLHVQPESSVDVRGSYYCNQLEVIVAIARSLPVTHNLIVKEHSNSIGTRPLSFYKACKNIPGVILISPYEDSIKLIKGADLVISITGTPCLEAFLLGVKVLMLSKAFFSDLIKSNGFDIFSGRFSKIAKILQEPNLSREEAKIRGVKLIAHVLANSYSGTIGDTLSDPGVIESENINNLVQGFAAFLTYIKQSTCLV